MTKEKKLESILMIIDNLNKKHLRELCMVLWLWIREKDFRYTISYDILKASLKTNKMLDLCYRESSKIYKEIYTKKCPKCGKPIHLGYCYHCDKDWLLK